MKYAYRFICLVLLCIAPSAQATSAYASLSNFSFEVTGPGISVIEDDFSAFSAAFLNNTSGNNFTTTLGPNLAFSVANTLTNGVNTASGGATYALNNPNSLVFAQTDGDLASASTTIAEFAFNYLANTVVTLSADAFIDHLPPLGNEGVAVGQAQIDINSLSPYSSHAGIIRQTAEPFSLGERISATFTAPIDTTLLLYFTTAVRINEFDQPSPVPEPQTYAMLLMGLGLIGFVAKRRKSRVLDI